MTQVVIALASGLLGWGLTGLVLIAVRNSGRLAAPTDRGLHAVATPVGGGLGLIGATLILWSLLFWPISATRLLIGSAILSLAILSWIDDRAQLPPALRLVVQAAVMALIVFYLVPTTRLFPAIPFSLERIALWIGWLWMLNLTNFMDGIDGLAGIEAITVALGYALLTGLFPYQSPIVAFLPELALILAAASFGYLYWNWSPAKIFMGDTGSIPLGFIFGLLMLDLALRGFWAAAVILPMYFIADATLTLLDRLRRGAKPWHAHREHAYQQAVLSGMTHAQVALHIAVLNIALIALAILSTMAPLPTAAASAILTLGLITWFQTRDRPAI